MTDPPRTVPPPDDGPARVKPAPSSLYSPSPYSSSRRKAGPR